MTLANLSGCTAAGTNLTSAARRRCPLPAAAPTPRTSLHMFPHNALISAPLF